MNSKTRFVGSLLLPVLWVSTPAAAQEPRVVNAKLQTRGAAGLEKEFHALVSNQVGPAWIGYAVPAALGCRWMCCRDSLDDFRGIGGCCDGCRLESENNSFVTRNDIFENGRVDLESPASILVLFRVNSKKVGKIRAFSEDCELDAGGLPFYWLTGVRPAESVVLLGSFVSASQGEPEEEWEGLRDSALAALALHADVAADRALEKFVADGQPDALREHAAFWLGSERGRFGYEVLRRLVKEDPNDSFRQKAIFALSVSRVPEAVDTMIGVARSDRSAQVRGQALFWLAQKAGKKAASAITEAIESDPETEVKKRAVFALSQLPKDEGVPILIRVARTNRNPAVREAAAFWLGQSNDDRALAFFEEILTGQPGAPKQ